MTALKWINTCAFAAMVIVNALANLIPIGGSTTGQISEAYPNLFTPAPVTFAIWGLIYALMALFVVYQWGVFDHGLHSEKVLEDVGLWFAVSCALNIAWIFLWHFKQIGISALCITLLLITLIVIRKRVSGAGGGTLLEAAAKAGFSVYFGWIIAATISNLCVLMTQLGWSGTGMTAELVTVGVMLTGAIATSLVVLIGSDRTAALAVMWAYAGILIRHISQTYYGGTHPYVICAGIVSEAIMLAAILMPVICRTFGGNGYVSIH